MRMRCVGVAIATSALVISSCAKSGDLQPRSTSPETSRTDAPCSPTDPPEPTPSPAKSAPPSAATPVAPNPSPAATIRRSTAIEWTTIPTEERVVALTIDCGGNAAGVPKVLEALDQADAPATFFLTGRWVEVFPDAAKRIAARYPFGNHTYSHPHMAALSEAGASREVEQAEEAIQTVVGSRPHKLFRFPFGERNPRLLELIGVKGYTSVFWTIDTLGWKGKTDGRSVATIIDRVVAALRPGAIVLMHIGSAQDGSTLDADALPSLVAAVRARGYTLVDLNSYVS
jgi:peptidoglycan/xylan/chitin deacetylase (PgdA/CDA1 family)